MKTVLIEFLALIVFQSTAVQIVYNACCRLATGVPSKNLKSDRSGCWIYLIMLVLIDPITVRNGTAVIFAFECVFGHASCYLFRKVGRIILRHAFKHRFKNNTFSPLRDSLCCGNNFHIVLFQHSFVLGRVVPVSGESVEFPNDDNIEILLRTVLDHPLKFRAVIGLSRKCSVNVCTDNVNAVLFCKRHVFSNLSFN